MYLCIFMTLMIPFIVLKRFWMIWHQSRYTGGRVLATKKKKCVLFWNLHLRVQMVWKRTGLFLVCITTLNYTFGTVLVKHTGWVGQQAADSSCSLLAVMARVRTWWEGSGDVQSRLRKILCFTCFTDDKITRREIGEKRRAESILRSLFCSFFL